MIDFTFKNELIKNYFNGDDSYVPSSELVYLHEHPLIRDSFLVEIERIINETSQYLVKKNMRGQVLDKFVKYTIALGQDLQGEVTLENAPKILSHFRNVYSLCVGLLK